MKRIEFILANLDDEGGEDTLIDAGHETFFVQNASAIKPTKGQKLAVTLLLSAKSGDADDIDIGEVRDFVQHLLESIA